VRVRSRPLPGLQRLRVVEEAVARGASESRERGPERSAAARPAAFHAAVNGREAGPQDGRGLGWTARQAAVATLVALGLVALALALWKIRIVVALLLLGFTIAAAMRPGVDALRKRGLPRVAGILVHYALIAGVAGLFLWLVVPQAIDQVQAALGGNAIGEAARRSSGFERDVLQALDRQLNHLPSASELVDPAVEYGRKAFEVFIGMFFTFATAAYWIYERDRAVDLVCSLVSRPRRKKLRDTWELIDLKLGAFVRGQLLLIVLVGAALSLAFWAIGLPYWLLIGSFAGIVEIVPVVGPLAAGALAVGIGFTHSVHTAVLAGLVVLGVRLVEDYLVIPKVLGHSVGLSPLVVLVSVTAVGILFGGFAVILAIPLASAVATLLDVVVRDRDPAEEDVPAVMFPAKDAEP
jgi:predicted PurR-regulated permease PerM